MFRPICLETVSIPGFAVAGLASRRSALAGVLELLGLTRSLATSATVLKPLLVMIAFSLTAVSHAAVFERDWKVPGDGLLTFDDVNNREWLDISQSLKPDLPGTNTEEDFQYVVQQTAPGEIYDGFTVATGIEVTAFAQSAGIDTTTADFATNAIPMQALIELLGNELSFPPFDAFIFGILADLSDQESRRGLVSLVIDKQQSAVFSRGVITPIHNDRFGIYMGFMMYREANSIPEPTSLSSVIAFSILSGLYFSRTRRISVI